jgi:predicted transcriptional regulator
MMIMLQKRLYQKKKQTIEKFIKRFGKVEHSFILNEVNIDYDTLMKILAELRNEGRIK